MPRRTRLVAHGSTVGLVALGELGWTELTRAERSGVDRHTHPGMWELCLLVRGRLVWSVNGSVVEHQAGQIFATHPDEPHGSVSGVLEPCILAWMEIAPQHLPGLEPAAAKRLLTALACLAPCWSAPVGCAAAWHDLVLAGRAGGPWVRERTLYRVLTILTDLAAQVPGTTGASARSAAIARCQAWAETQTGAPPTVTQLAALADLSPARLHARFIAEVGDTPAGWLRHLRQTRAETLLRDQQRPITAIAMDLGFASSQHFAHWFRRATGLSPSAWRNTITQER